MRDTQAQRWVDQEDNRRGYIVASEREATRNDAQLEFIPFGEREGAAIDRKRIARPPADGGGFARASQRGHV